MDLSQYLGVFLSECKENLQRLSECLLVLEQKADSPTLDEIFRIAHTIKGMASTMGFSQITDLTHQMENLLDQLRHKEKEITQGIVDLLFKCSDALEDLINNVTAQVPKQVDTEKLIKELQEYTVIPIEATKQVAVNIIEGDWTVDWGAKYTEEESKIIANAAKERKRCLELHVTLMPYCQMKSVRIALVLRNIKEIANIIKTFPSEEELMAERVGERFTIVIITDLEENKIKDAVLSVSEIRDVEIFNLLGETVQSVPGFVEDTAPVEFILPTFTDYEKNLVSEARKQGFNIFVLGIYLLPGVLMKAARVALIIRRLEKFGEIIKTEPTIEDLEEEKFGNYFQVVLVTNESSQKIMNIVLNIAEVRDFIKMTHVTMDEKFASIKQVSLTGEIIEEKRLKQTEPLKEIAEIKQPSKIKEITPIPDTSAKTPVQSPAKHSKLIQTVRVDAEKLDSLMTLVGELVISRTHLAQLTLESRLSIFTQGVHKLTNIINKLQTLTMKLRMVPVEHVFSRFPRTIRDLGKMLHKEIDLITEGEETELDRTLIDELGEPLMHLIRNAADHGLESTSERILKNKPQKGTIKLKAKHEGNQIFIFVQDDGRGINIEKIKRKALEQGIINPEQLDKSDEKIIKELIFAPGFSTSENVSDISGRGVGLDAVKSKIESLGGTIEIFSTEDKGSTFVIKLPLTLAIMQSLLTEVGKEVYAVPLAYVEEAKNVPVQEVKSIQGKEVVIIRDFTLPLLHLSQFFTVHNNNKEKTVYSIVVVKSGDKKIGLVVDNLMSQCDIVIKPLSKFINVNPYIAGAATLGDGRIALILNVPSLV